MLRSILIAIPVILVIFALVVSMRPADFRVTRTAKITAPPSVVFPHVNDLHLWQEWSPWAKADPSAKLTYEGPTAGTGAAYSWEGDKVGAGHLAIADSQLDRSVHFNLDFTKPFAASNKVEFTFTPEGDQTVVNWTMTGKNNFLMKAVGLFMNCDKMCGDQFEQGLASLKEIAEAKPAVTTR